MKLGRNDPCHCGSGKKYKKCCMNKDEFIKSIEDIPANEKVFNHLSYEEVDEYSTEELSCKLREIGVPFEKETFLHEVEVFHSAEDLSKHWYRQYNLNLTGRMADFPWFVAWVLWNRLAEPQNPSMEALSELVERGYDALEADDPIKACDDWLQFWELLKHQMDPYHNTLNYLDERYSGGFFIGNVVQDLELTLEEAGQQDPTYYEKRLIYCQSFCEYFPNEEHIYHNMRRAIADTYSRLNRYEEAEREFEQLIVDVPENPWSYIGLADMLFLDKKEQYSRAKSLYLKALPLTETHPYGDKEAVEDRLQMMEHEERSM